MTELLPMSYHRNNVLITFQVFGEVFGKVDTWKEEHCINLITLGSKDLFILQEIDDNQSLVRVKVGVNSSSDLNKTLLCGYTVLTDQNSNFQIITLSENGAIYRWPILIRLTTREILRTYHVKKPFAMFAGTASRYLRIRPNCHSMSRGNIMDLPNVRNAMLRLRTFQQRILTGKTVFSLVM